MSAASAPGSPRDGAPGPRAARGVARELTPPGRGGVSVVLLEGPAGRAAFARLAGAEAAARLADGVPRVVRLALPAPSAATGAGAPPELLDVALAVDAGPASGGGIELHLHGSPPLVRAVLRALDLPARVAPSRVEERAAALLARAASEAAARMLLDQAEGALRRELVRLIPATPERWRARLLGIAARWDVAARLVTPPRVVLAGPVNAGKSTLFNALLGRRRVVESGEEGTTRDAIAETCLLGAYAVELVDTAGERDVPEAGSDRAGGGGRAGRPRVADAAQVERAGQALARELRGTADLVLWLDPGGAPPPELGAGVVVGASAGVATGTVAGAAAAASPVAGVRAIPLRVLAARGDRAGAGRGALRPREDPLGARAAVEEAFHAALGLPRDPWTPGAGAPLGPADAAALAALARHGAGGGVSTAARWGALQQLLGPAPLGAALPGR